MYWTFLEKFIWKSYLCGVSCFFIDDKHTRRGVYATVYHIGSFLVIYFSDRNISLIIPDFTIAESGIPQTVKDVIITCFCKYQCCFVGFDSRNNIFVFLRNVKYFYMFKVYNRVWRKEFEPCKNRFVWKYIVFCIHEITSFQLFFVIDI